MSQVLGLGELPGGCRQFGEVQPGGSFPLEVGSPRRCPSFACHGALSGAPLLEISEHPDGEQGHGRRTDIGKVSVQLGGGWSAKQLRRDSRHCHHQKANEKHPREKHGYARTSIPRCVGRTEVQPVLRVPGDVEGDEGTAGG